MLRNRVKCLTATTGAGAVAVGAAVTGFRTFASAYSADAVVQYVIDDGDAWEVGRGEYARGTGAGGTLYRTAMENSSTGALLNLSGNAVVSVQFLASDNPSDWPVLVTSSNADVGGFFQNINRGMGFTTLIMTTVSVDTHGGWDPVTYTYVVPQTGVYDLQGKVRLNDNSLDNGNGVSHGIGLDIANQDSSGFLWATFPTSSLSGNGAARFVLYNSRQMQLMAGQRLRAFAYVDAGNAQTINKCELVATRVR